MTSPKRTVVYPSLQPATLNGNDTAGQLTSADTWVCHSPFSAPASSDPNIAVDCCRVDPLLALQQVQPMGDVLEDTEAPRRFNTASSPALPWGRSC